jgi:hypothetical protein
MTPSMPRLPEFPVKPDMFKLLDELPARRYMDMLRYRVQMLNQALGKSAYFDQYPGKTVPYMFSKLYGPIGQVTPRRVGVTGWLGQAPVANPAIFILPRQNNVLTGRDGVFYWCSTNATNLLSWTRTSAASGPVVTKPVGDIFTPVIDNNGGARILQNLSDVNFNYREPSISWDIDIYDKRRGRSITSGRIPAETIFGGTMGYKKWKKPVRWDVDTEIEPRLYVNHARVPFQDTNGPVFDASQVAFYVNVVFKGFLALEERPHG